MDRIYNKVVLVLHSDSKLPFVQHVKNRIWVGQIVLLLFGFLKILYILLKCFHIYSHFTFWQPSKSPPPPPARAPEESRWRQMPGGRSRIPRDETQGVSIATPAPSSCRAPPRRENRIPAATGSWIPRSWPANSHLALKPSSSTHPTTPWERYLRDLLPGHPSRLACVPVLLLVCCHGASVFLSVKWES